MLAAELNMHAPASSKWNPNRVKAWLAEKVVITMTTKMIAEIDPAGELLGWMNEIKAMLS
jgi:hypothetical protein